MDNSVRLKKFQGTTRDNEDQRYTVTEVIKNYCHGISLLNIFKNTVISLHLQIHGQSAAAHMA